MKKNLFRKYGLFIFLLCSINGYAQQVLYDLNYSASKIPQCEMDLYLPNKAEKFPSIVFLHEGGLIGGDKRENNLPQIAKKFQDDGIAVALVNYRLSPALWPAEPDDACEAFAWVKKHISGYGGDSTAIFIAGHSSGALLAALVSTDPKYMAKQGFTTNDIAGSIIMGTQLQAIVPAVSETRLNDYFQNNEYFRIFQNRQTFEDASPALHINKNIPAMRFIIAEAEQINPPILSQTEGFVNQAKVFNKDIRYDVIPDRRHITNLTKMIEPNDPVYRIIKDFISPGK